MATRPSMPLPEQPSSSSESWARINRNDTSFDRRQDARQRLPL
jgi:hypothetical protein